MKKNDVDSKIIGLAGNPNVGKSTIFNTLTGLKQHTGNWPGKTVENASGRFSFQEQDYILYDLPGTYSLIAHSKEEECARDFICFEPHDAILVVCDAVCLERNLNLVLQTIEITPNVVVVVNLIDEAEKKKIHIDIPTLQKELQVPVVATSARSGKGLKEMLTTLAKTASQTTTKKQQPIVYPPAIQHVQEMLLPFLNDFITVPLPSSYVALKLLLEEQSFMEELQKHQDCSFLEDPLFTEQLRKAHAYLETHGITKDKRMEYVVQAIVQRTEEIAKHCISFRDQDYQKRDRKIDRILTNKWTGIPIMLLLLMGIFWITMVGANYPSQLLFDLFQWLKEYILWFLQAIGSPSILTSILVDGVYHVLTWVISVMLPPMAIFFPLFTLLEDFGYLPRIAFNLDKIFRKCSACGKQALTMCMGFGCNAVGVTGCRIIDSPRERLIAMITNNFVPCNGRFPTIISIITMFFVGFSNSFGASFKSILLLVLIILLGIGMTFLISKILSKTLLKGVPSSFTLELPPYRKPQIGKVIVHSIFDRTLFVLGRAIMVAAPAGLIIWCMANIHINGLSILNYCANFFDPFAQLIGLDGVILMAFILGFPANEIVVPIIIMAYLATNQITDFSNLMELKTLLIDNHWTWITAGSMMLFSLMHWPCSTTLLTIKKESGSWKWTLLSFLIPTLCGLIACFLFTTIARCFI